MIERIESEVATVLNSLKQAGRNASEYEKFLESATDEVAVWQSEAGIRQIVGRLLSRTRAMALQSLELEKQLRASSSEVAKLKTELDGARREALVDTLTGLAIARCSTACCVKRRAAPRNNANPCPCC
jgi:diguanylate cyclase